ncbi:MAG TPA: (2Fe-2S)-binding protein [Acidimicrobiales bacterium]|nr:(2Fe-2S)-binding protein [Acidimicrobiales bacterium]
MVVCHCEAVNDRRIREEIAAGALDAEALAERCGAGGRCGGCQETVDALLAQFGPEPERQVA